MSGPGESLTLTHDTIEPALAYGPGIRVALAAARDARGVVVGLDSFLDIGIRLPRPVTRTSGRRGRRTGTGRARDRRMTTRIGVALMAVLLALYIVLVAQRAWLLLTSGEPIAIAMGVGLVILPVIAVWALGRELWFGIRAERLGRRLQSEGGLPAESVGVRPSGRVLRDDADAVFPVVPGRGRGEPGRLARVVPPRAGLRRVRRPAARTRPQCARRSSSSRASAGPSRPAAGTAASTACCTVRVRERESRLLEHFRHHGRIGREQRLGRVGPEHELDRPHRRAQHERAVHAHRQREPQVVGARRSRTRRGSPGPATSESMT